MRFAVRKGKDMNEKEVRSENIRTENALGDEELAGVSGGDDISGAFDVSGTRPDSEGGSDAERMFSWRLNNDLFQF